MRSLGHFRVALEPPASRRFGVRGGQVWWTAFLVLCFMLVSTNAALVPTATWTNLYSGASSVSGTSSNTVLPGGQPHSFGGGGTAFWKLNNLAVMCSGGASAARTQCATWNDQTESWIWINTAHLTSAQVRVYGSTWVDLPTSTIYVYGGHDWSACGSSTMYKATVNPTTGVVSAFTTVAATVPNPGTRSYTTHWQDPTTGYFYLFGGANCTDGTRDATNSDLWMFFPSNATWTQLKGNVIGLSSNWSSYNVEVETNWPSIRRSAITVLSNDGRYVYMYGGSQMAFTLDFPLADLWRFNLANRQWTVLRGVIDSTSSSRYSYDESGFQSDWVPAAARDGAIWMDGNGYIWMYGGIMHGAGMVNDLWTLSPSVRIWGRVKGMPFLQQTSILPTYSRRFSWPGTFANSVYFRKSSDPSILYTIGGWGFSTTQTASAQAIPDIWRLKVDVKTVPGVSTVPLMPQAPAGHATGLAHRYSYCPNNAPTIDDLHNAATVQNTVDSGSGFVLRNMFGNAAKSQTVSLLDRTKCFGRQSSGYLWNPTNTPVTFRFWVAADDGVQIEWASQFQYVLQPSTWNGATTTPFSNHRITPFISETLLLNPGATWFRVNYYDIGATGSNGAASLLVGLVGEDSFSNFRMLHTSFVTQNYIPPTPTPTLMPTATWTPVDLRQASQTTGAAPNPATWPGSVEEGMKWEIGDYVVLCGSRSSGFASGCATWRHSTQSWAWIEASFSNPWRAAATFVRASESTIYMYGGADDMNSVYAGMWSSVLNTATGALSAWVAVTQTNSPSNRALATFWQDSNDNFYIFSGGKFEAAYDDLWMFNSSNQWTLIGTGLPAGLFFNSSWSGTYGTEDDINWPSARSRSYAVRDRVNANYVYMFGGSGVDRFAPSNDLWRFNIQTRRWALLSGLWYNRGARWWQTGIFSSYSEPPSLSYPQLHADPNGLYLWLWSGVMSPQESHTSMWCFRLSDRLWARVPSPNAKLLPTVKYGPPYWSSQSQFEQIWFYNGVIYTFGGKEVGSSAQPSLPLYPKVSLWNLTVNVTTVDLLFPLSTSAPPTTSEPVSNRGLVAKYYSGFSSCPTGATGFLSFPSTLLKGTVTETGALIRQEWGSQTPPLIPAGTECFAVEWTGYFWNPGTGPLYFKLKAMADDGVQVEWRQPGATVFTASTDYKHSAWSPHPWFEYESDVLVALPGPNWFRASFFDSGAEAGFHLIMVDSNGFTNPRMLHSDFFSKSVTSVVPQASWTVLHTQQLPPTNSPDSPNPGTLPHYMQGANFWQYDGAIIACGGFKNTYSDDCAVWSENDDKWLRFGTATFTPALAYGITFIDSARSRLWVYGGKTATSTSSQFWYATYEPASFSIISGWTSLVVSGPGPRTAASFWQDDSENLWMWSGSNSTANTANTADMWMFNINSLTWTLISAGPTSTSAWRTSVFGTIGVEASTNWPQIRRLTSIVRKRGSNYVYMYGGSPDGLEATTDLWRFNMLSRNWCFLGGMNRPWAGSSYTDGLYSSDYVPASTFGGALFMDFEGDLWLFGGASSAGSQAFLWTYSVQKQMFARVAGSPYTWHTTSTSTWPGSMLDFGYFQSSLDPNAFIILGGYGFSDLSENALANVWRVSLGARYTASPPQEPASLSTIDQYPSGMNVSYYQFTTTGPITPTYSSFSNNLVATDIDTSKFLLRQDLGYTYRPNPGVSRAGTWGVRYEGYYHNPTQTSTSFRFLVHSDDGAWMEWGNSSAQVLQGLAYSQHVPADFLSSILTASPGFTFFRLSLFDSGEKACLIAGIVDTDGVSNYRPLHKSFIKRSLEPMTAPAAAPVAAPTDAPVAAVLAEAPAAAPTDAPWPNSSSFTFVSSRDLADTDIMFLSGKLCEIARDITGKTAVTCSIVPVVSTRRATGQHSAEMQSGDSGTASSVSQNLEAIKAAFMALLNSPSAPFIGDNTGTTNGGGGSAGIIAGVVIGILVVIVIILVVLFVVVRRRRAASAGQEKPEPTAAHTKPTNEGNSTEMVEVDTAPPQPAPPSAAHYSDAALIKSSKQTQKQESKKKLNEKEKPKEKAKAKAKVKAKEPKKQKPKNLVTAEVDDGPDDLKDDAPPDAVGEPKFDTSDFKSAWMIPFTEIEIEKKLGAGAFGIVYAGSYNDTEVAIKQTNLSVGQNSLDEFKREAVLLLSMKPHPSVVQVLGVSVSESNIYMVMEFCEFGSLDVYMQANSLSNDDKIKILDSCAAGIAHLHRNHVVHRDIAARNVLLAGGLRAKLADFGMSRIVDKFEAKGTTAASVGPIKYMAPESLTKNKEFSPASDCWTFGILCIEVWTGVPPHADVDMLEVAYAIRDQGVHPEIPSDMPEWLLALVSKCLQLRAADRITMSSISKIFREQRSRRGTVSHMTLTPGHTSGSQYPGSASSMPGSGGSFESN